MPAETFNLPILANKLIDKIRQAQNNKVVVDITFKKLMEEEPVDYFSLLAACFESTTHHFETKCLMDLLPEKESIPHRHLGFLLHQMKKHNIKTPDLEQTKTDFTQDDVDRWSDFCYQELMKKNKTSSPIALDTLSLQYLANLFPELPEIEYTRQWINKQTCYQNSTSFYENGNYLGDMYELAGLFMTTQGQRFLANMTQLKQGASHNGFVDQRFIKQTDALRQQMVRNAISLYTQSSNTELKTAIHTYVQGLVEMDTVVVTKSISIFDTQDFERAAKKLQDWASIPEEASQQQKVDRILAITLLTLGLIACALSVALFCTLIVSTVLCPPILPLVILGAVGVAISAVAGIAGIVGGALLLAANNPQPTQSCAKLLAAGGLFKKEVAKEVELVTADPFLLQGGFVIDPWGG